MDLRLGDIGSRFTAETNDGQITVSRWIGYAGRLLFCQSQRISNQSVPPKLGEASRLKPEFDKRNVKVSGSVLI